MDKDKMLKLMSSGTEIEPVKEEKGLEVGDIEIPADLLTTVEVEDLIVVEAPEDDFEERQLGVVVPTKEEAFKQQMSEYGHYGAGITKDASDKIDAKFSQMNEVIEKGKELAKEGKKLMGPVASRTTDEQVETEELNEPETEEIPEDVIDDENLETRSGKTLEEVTIIIDKSGLGSVNFTDEEREKMTASKAIRVKEVENKEVKARKSKRLNSKNIKKVIKGNTKKFTATAMAVYSGYSAVVEACSAFEIAILSSEISNDSINIDKELRKKWSIIHSKIISTSIGYMSFDEFCLHTHPSDYLFFIYALICATFGNGTKSITLQCGACGKTYQQPFTIKSLIRPELMSAEMLDAIEKINYNANIEEDAKAYHKNESLVMRSKEIELPESGIIVTYQAENVFDNINRVTADMLRIKKEVSPEKAQMVILTACVGSIELPDPEGEDDEYLIATDTEDMVEVICSLSQIDLGIFEKYISEINKGFSVPPVFGVEKATCPNKIKDGKVCGVVTDLIPVDIESILFRIAHQETAEIL